MQRLLEVIDRAYAGPPCQERDFDMKHVAAGTASVVKKYGIKIDRDSIIQRDDAMIDRLWEAAVDFLEICRVYNTSTGRRITFTRDEILDATRDAPSEITIGEGADERLVFHHDVEDRRAPIVVGGPIGTPLSEGMYVPIMRSYVQEPIIDSTTPGTLATTYRRQPRTNSPLETAAARQEVKLMSEASHLAGRPGMSIGGVQMGMSGVGYLSAISHGDMDLATGSRFRSTAKCRPTTISWAKPFIRWPPKESSMASTIRSWAGSRAARRD